MNAYSILGLREAADAAAALGLKEDQKLFTDEADDLKRSPAQVLRGHFQAHRPYERALWFGVEERGDGMYGMWGHTPLVWPCRSFDPHDPMLTATWRKMERASNQFGGGIMSEVREAVGHT